MDYEIVAVLQTGKLQLMELLEGMQEVLFSGAALVAQAVCFVFVFDSSS